jgi:hypothetical protein
MCEHTHIHQDDTCGKFSNIDVGADGMLVDNTTGGEQTLNVADDSSVFARRGDQLRLKASKCEKGKGAKKNKGPTKSVSSLNSPRAKRKMCAKRSAKASGKKPGKPETEAEAEAEDEAQKSVGAPKKKDKSVMETKNNAEADAEAETACVAGKKKTKGHMWRLRLKLRLILWLMFQRKQNKKQGNQKTMWRLRLWLRLRLGSRLVVQRKKDERNGIRRIIQWLGLRLRLMLRKRRAAH